MTRSELFQSRITKVILPYLSNTKGCENLAIEVYEKQKAGLFTEDSDYHKSITPYLQSIESYEVSAALNKGNLDISISLSDYIEKII